MIFKDAWKQRISLLSKYKELFNFKDDNFMMNSIIKSK